MNDHLELTDELLVRALRARTDVPMPTTLLSRVMAVATATRQEHAARRWPALRDGSRTFALPFPAIAGLAVAAAVFVGVVGLRMVFTGPAAPPSPSPLATTSTVAPTAGAPTPEARSLGSHAALRLALGRDTAPMDVVSAFGSIWIADIHANDVRRYEPSTMAEIARIPVQGGPAWFVEADGALWVSTQLGLGVTRIDPTSNTVAARVGDDPPCTAPFVVGGDLWQAACDGDVILRIDPARNAVLERIPAQGHTFLVVANGIFITNSVDGIARFDPVARTFQELPAYAGPSGALPFSDGQSVWVAGGTAVLRVDPADGHTLASFPYPGSTAITFDRGSAWITTASDGVVQVDIATNTVTQQIAVPDPWVARAAGDFVWVTDFNNSALWRATP